MHRADGFHLVHLTHTPPPYELLVPPSEYISTQIKSSQFEHTSVRSRSTLGRTLRFQQYNSDYDSSDDELRHSSYHNVKFTRNFDQRSDIITNSSNRSSINTKPELNRISRLQTQKNVEGKSFH